ncbi:glycoside hydrolase family 3 N-terminal domain-containing protein [Melioribacteraceae bacterium 4301-Me]|uniref:glycoside hydrolase family 3 N-terminal domain-containing protein n=1 Tax=Pyranulibacter aquaticus TaxID=3163344 RepID=UPI003595E70C
MKFNITILIASFAFASLIFSQQTNTSKIFNNNADQWVESILSKMTIEEKAGQMVFPEVFGKYMSVDSRDYKRIEHLVKDLHVGGLIFFNSNIYDQAVLTNKLQSIAKIPLLIAADYERGVAQSAVDATVFPYNMGIGAADDTELTFQMGKIIAEEGKAIGVNQDYAPVSDVNNNPLNPIINVRSFGENVELVERLSNAFLKGIQAGGMIATSKHFPGHGNTNIDSHQELPLITSSKEELRRLELAPFKSNIENGVMSVMIGHLEVPAFEKEKNLPSTLSKSIVTDLLQKEMGFKGLIVTDALNMHAITNSFSTAEATVKAVQAGNDCILFPDDPEEAINAIIEAVKKGDLTEERLNHSVRKILLAKKWAGLNNKKFVDIDDIANHVGIKEHWNISVKLARKSITLVKDDNHLIPVLADANKNFLHIIISDENYSGNHTYFDNLLKERLYHLNTDLLPINSDDKDFEKTIADTKNADEVFISIYLKVRAFSGNLGLTEPQIKLIKDVLALKKPTVISSHGNPYVLSLFPEAPTYLCNYGDTEVSEAALAEAIFGEIPITGKLPISIPNTKYIYGTGIKLKQTALRMENEFSSSADNKFKLVDEVIEKAIKDTAFPGTSLLIAKDGKIIYQKGYGHLTYDYTSRTVTPNTIYDLASVSKVIATTTATMICIDRGLFKLDDKVSKYIPQFAENGKENITIRNLLLHNSGLPAYKRYYEMYDNAEDVLNDIYTTKLDYPTGTKTVYSDLGMITVGKIIEKVTGKTLDQFCKEEIFNPLGMTSTFYNPPAIYKDRIAPTENDNYWRHRLLIGEVHDETASMLGGVAGHAGLFSTSGDLAKLLQMILQKGYYQGKKFIEPQTVELFTKRQSEESSRALGWDTKSEKGSSAGNLFSPNSYGHTGYTGTSVWTDPERKLIVVFLTNRVYPTRNNLKILNVRPALHDAVIKSITGLL